MHLPGLQEHKVEGQQVMTNRKSLRQTESDGVLLLVMKMPNLAYTVGKLTT